MIQNQTVRLSKPIGKQKVSLTCLEHLSTQGNFLLDLIEKEHKTYDILKDNYKIQVGWSFYILCLHDGVFSVLSPDHISNPFKETTEDLSLSLFVQVQQNEVLKKAKIQGESVSFQDTILVHKDALKSDSLCLERMDGRQSGESGWFIGTLDDTDSSSTTENDFKQIYVYELLHSKPELMKFLSLPTGCLVVLENKEITVLDTKNERLL
ncbi:hypothetical protein CVD28_02275 [Bacillus sp. M6-12]|uniref:immunity protein Imm33 domain-containing protein n=1 Tax=Bacillus sp. M6-12 TaxID=2054166 RepID=UPI000C7586B9|nr:hypothetical protein [Bacillus sp. M6-12]PLS19259.1 hypothetical protein CVD28_02275 [Bacillus sp. M6-12]